MTAGNLADLGVRALLDGYRSKAFTPVEVMQAVTARIDTSADRTATAT